LRINNKQTFLKNKFARVNNLDLYSIEDKQYQLIIDDETPEDLIDGISHYSRQNTPVKMNDDEQRFVDEDMVIYNKNKNELLDDAINTIGHVKENAVYITKGIMKNKYSLEELKKTMDSIKDKVDSNNQNMNNIIKKINADGACLFKIIAVIILILLIMIIFRFLGIFP